LNHLPKVPVRLVTFAQAPIIARLIIPMGGRGRPVSGTSIIGEMIYPLDVIRKIERGWDALLTQLGKRHHSKPATTIACSCGHVAAAPCQSTISAVGVINQWHCSTCDLSWYTYADSAPNPGERPVMHNGIREWIAPVLVPLFLSMVVASIYLR
jgi:hypothetical protein